MSCLGNLIWLVFGGFFAGLGYIIGGVVLCLTIIGIPFGVQSIKLGIATFAPFGLEIIDHGSGSDIVSIVFNIIWVLLFGWEIAVAHLTGALLLAITIIGLPFAAQHIKLIPLALFPFGKELR